MLVLAATNMAGVVLFSTLYAVAAMRPLSRSAFFVLLAALFVLVTVLWVRAEAQNRAFHPLSRVGRAAAGLFAVVVGVPALLLMPLFWLDGLLPAETGLNRVAAVAMTVVLVALVFIVVVNVVGAVVVAARGAHGAHGAWRRRGAPPGR